MPLPDVGTGENAADVAVFDAKPRPDAPTPAHDRAPIGLDGPADAAVTDLGARIDGAVSDVAEVPDVVRLDTPDGSTPRDAVSPDVPALHDVLDVPAPRDVVSTDSPDVPAPRPPGVTLGMWCGIPERALSVERVREAAEAGFTLLNFPCEATSPAYNARLLAMAAEVGLDVIVDDPRLRLAGAGNNPTGNVDAVVRELGGAPALWGYHLVDEPSATAFPALGAAVRALRARDPARRAYLNVFPDYASPAQLGTPDYDTYLRRLLDEVAPPVLSYDHYNFTLDGGDGASFFANLASARAQALPRGVPFWQYIQAISYVGHRATNGPEKRWAALHTLAYGGTGVLYFTYWTPPQTSENFGEGLLTLAGARTAQFEQVRAINRELTAMGRHLATASSVQVFHHGPLVSGATPRTPGAPVDVPSPAAITVGTFRAGDDVLALLVNREHRAPVTSDVWLASADGSPARLDINTGAWVPLPVLAREGASARVSVSLEAGGGALVRLRGPVPRGPDGAEAYFGTVRADAGWLDVVDRRFGTQRVRTAGWNACPAGYRVVGRDFQSDGFWLCAREDLASRTFYVGNVVRDGGAYYRVSGGGATRITSQFWNTCVGGSLLGRRFESNGFWVCME